VELLLAAVHHLKNSGHPVSALLIGDEPSPRLRERVRELDVSDVVEFRPNLPLQILRDTLRTLDLFVVPSYQEGLCIAALEAMSCGCPVVSTYCGGPGEFVLENETGFFVGFDPGEMADAILRILRDPKLRRRMGEAARDKVLSDYSFARANDVFWRAFHDRFAIQ
jgi:glycosyltransferase involved in cell wall biosynthesis